MEKAVLLLVEDDPGDQELMRRALLQTEMNTDLHVVSDGSEGLNYLKNQNPYDNAQEYPRPDLILLDLNMPGMDGRDFLSRIRNDALLKPIPVVVLTTSTHERDIHHSYELGCNSYLTKTNDPARFSRQLRDLTAYWFGLVRLPGSTHP